LGPFGKHVFAAILSFLGVPIVILVGKLGFRDLAVFLMLLDGSLSFWALGFWHLFKAIWKRLWFIILIS